jgi:hypothetical protein
MIPIENMGVDMWQGADKGEWWRGEFNCDIFNIF